MKIMKRSVVLSALLLSVTAIGCGTDDGDDTGNTDAGGTDAGGTAGKGGTGGTGAGGTAGKGGTGGTGGGAKLSCNMSSVKACMTFPAMNEAAVAANCASGTVMSSCPTGAYGSCTLSAYVGYYYPGNAFTEKNCTDGGGVWKKL